MISFSGTFVPADGQPPAAVEEVTFAIYAEETGGTPIWLETQSVQPDATGRYTVMLGATAADGLPLEVFASAEARWLGLVFTRPGEVEGPRVRITSVPYALRASDAETLGGRPASAYVLAPTAEGQGAESTTKTSSNEDASSVTSDIVLPGTQNFLAKYVTGEDVGTSGVFELGGLVGIGTTSPVDSLHVRFNNGNGGATGFAVQNLSNTATSYSGMLFYDHNGFLGQFQGFNNATHEYRINNVARNALTTQFDGSINFMIGGVSKFFADGFNVGIGTTFPQAHLEVRKEFDTTLLATSFNNSAPTLLATSARGSSTAPSAVQNGDRLGRFGAGGYTTSFFSGLTAGMEMRATENWTNSARGTSIAFRTTLNGDFLPVDRMMIDSSGFVGIGTTSPDVQVEVSAGFGTNVYATSYNGTPPTFQGRSARGTAAAPSAVQNTDILAFFSGGGYATNFFATSKAAISLRAAENWTNSAQGTSIRFSTTPIGSFDTTDVMTIDPFGSVGIGTVIPLDRLQVVGDIRVGTSGTNGCLKNFSGGPIMGTCASDRRFKRDVTSFAPALAALARLRPVHYFWRIADFPERHFGESRAYGLIAQEVEQVLPELVVTDADGYKTVDYGKLPLLTIQAVKELKAENDALKSRLVELERLMNELLVRPRR